jgi:hypothetical protein
MLIGALMQGRQDAIQRLLHMRRSTRLRIESEIKRLRHRRQGRPLAV